MNQSSNFLRSKTELKAAKESSENSLWIHPYIEPHFTLHSVI